MYFSYNSHHDRLDYLSIDYSDDEIKNYLEENHLSYQKFISHMVYRSSGFIAVLIRKLKTTFIASRKWPYII